MITLALFGVACGSGTPSSPSDGAATPNAVVNVQLRLDEGGAGIQTLENRPVVRYYACGSIQNTGAPISYTLELEPIDADGNAYHVVLSSTLETMATNGSRVGCGFVSAFDKSFAHPAALSYRFRVRYRPTSGGAERVVESTAAVRQFFAALPPRLIVSEFRTRGPNGPSDQFIELFNDSVTPKNLSGGVVFGGNRNSSTTGSVNLPAITIGPGCHFLLTAPGYSGAVRGDATMAAFLRDDGHIRLGPGGNTFPLEVFRYVGMDGSWQYYEGSPLDPFGEANTDRSYMLTGQDTNDNGRDFKMVSPSQPQNSTSC